MSKICSLLLLSLQFLLSSSYYISPVVTNALVQTCRCGPIVPEAKCDSVFHSPEMECGTMSVVYAATTHPECSQAYVTCTKQGPQWQSIGIVGKVQNNDNTPEWSLLSNRKLTVHSLTLTCDANGSWIREDLEGNPFVYPLQIQCASSDASDAFDYYVTNNGVI